MPTSRSHSRRPRRSTLYQKSPPGPADLARQAIQETTDQWIRGLEGRTHEDAVHAFEEIAPIVSRHWGDILERYLKAYTSAPNGAELLTLQKELHFSTVVSMNEMMKEVMGTKAFAAMAGESLGTYLKAKIALDRMTEETLKSMRVPTRTDFDDLQASIRNLGGKVDELLAHETRRTAGRRTNAGGD